LIWLKRIIPFVIILGGWFGYQYYTNTQLEQKSVTEDKYALLTAQLWVASAKYRLVPEQFEKYRDSILVNSNLDSSKVSNFIDSYRDKADELGNFSEKVKIYIDSLVLIEDSLLGIKRVDTVKVK